MPLRDRAALPIALTPRLRLRLLTPADAPYLLRQLNEPSWLRFIGDRGVRTTAEAEQYIRGRIMAPYEQHGFGMYLVEDRAAAIPMGMCGLVKRESLPHADLGFSFLPEYWRQGLAAEAATAVMRHAANPLGHTRLLAITTPDNERSGRLLERLGFGLQQLQQLEPDGETLRVYACQLSHDAR
jgi:RimJ/RimL family protein N-acetyltransferase